MIWDLLRESDDGQQRVCSVCGSVVHEFYYREHELFHDKLEKMEKDKI